MSADFLDRVLDEDHPAPNGKGKRDDGLESEMRPPKPCSARMKSMGWCLMEQDHEGPHAGIPRAGTPPKPDYGPRRPR